MKKFATASFAAALIMTMSNLFSPVYAAEKNVNQYEVTYKDEKSIKSIVGSVFNKNLKKFDEEITSNRVVYTQDDMEIVVEGLNVNKRGEQSVKMTFTEKSGLENVNVPESYKYMISGNTLEKEVVVNVADKQNPTIEMDEEISTPVGEELDLVSMAKVSDDHKVASVKVKGDIDYNTDGVYNVELIAKDYSGNKTSQKVKVRVGNLNQIIADAALSQVGVFQDCTMLVTNALKSVGINFHGAPEDYLSLGTLTNEPVPGDICVYHGHVAIYIGDGMAVHGGWNGNQTVVTTVQCSNALIGYVHIEL